MNIDYSKITDNPRVIELLKQRIELENKIKAIDENALIKHEIELLALPDVRQTFLLCKKTMNSWNITEGKKYLLKEEYKRHYEIYNDNGEEDMFVKDIFEKV